MKNDINSLKFEALMIAAILCFIGLLSAMLYFIIFPCKAKTKNDTAIYMAIARSCNKNLDELTEEDFKNVKNLSLSDPDVYDIRKLAKLTNLKTLYLGHNFYATRVSNIKPLSKLEKLQKLDLRGTQINDDQIAELKKDLPDLEISR